VIKEVSDEVIIEEIELDIDVEVTEETKVEDVVYDVTVDEPEEEEVEEIFQIVEKRPEFKGGMKAFYQFVSRVYAFHFNSNGIKDRIIDVPAREVRRVELLAVESWGRKYIWS